MSAIDRWKGIRAVALEIAYDNGMMGFSEEDWLRTLDETILGEPEEELKILDDWCLTLSPEEQETLAAGEFDDMEELKASCPRPELCDLFNVIFEA